MIIRSGFHYEAIGRVKITNFKTPENMVMSKNMVHMRAHTFTPQHCNLTRGETVVIVYIIYIYRYTFLFLPVCVLYFVLDFFGFPLLAALNFGGSNRYIQDDITIFGGSLCPVHYVHQGLD